MIVPSWLPECAISRPNQALVAAGEGAGQGPASKFNCPFWAQDPSAVRRQASSDVSCLRWAILTGPPTPPTPRSPSRPIFHHTKSCTTCAIDTVTTNHRILLTLHYYNRLLKLYIMVLILAGFMMATATNPDLFPTASDPASHDQFESFKDEIQELIQQQNYTNKEVVAVLVRRGFTTSLRSLERRLRP